MGSTRVAAIFAVLFAGCWGPSRGQTLDQWAEEINNLGCTLFKVNCPPEQKTVVVDIDSLEARLKLDCRPASAEDLRQGYPHCYDRLRQDRALFRRSERTPGNPMLGGGAYRWVGGVQWSGEGAVFQDYHDSQVYRTYGYWRAKDFKVPFCGNGEVGTMCRRAAVCKMTEEVWGLYVGSDLVWRPVYNDKFFRVVTTENENANWPMRVTQQCLLCETAPCEPFSCANGKVPGLPIWSEPAYLNKVMYRQACGRDCSPGTFLTCVKAGSCAWKPPTSHEMTSGRSGLLAWWAYNAFQNVTGANLVHPDTTSPPVKDCYPCLYADRRTHAGVAMSTERSRAQKGFLDFFCPGGSLPPEDCPLNQVSKVDPATNRSGRCGCAGGYVWSEADGRCVLCPAGHFCSWEGTTPPVARECPNDYYSEGGAEVCRRCNTERQCDNGQALTRCLQNGASGESGKYQREDAQCVLCAECVQLGAGREGVPCYKVSALAAS
jgi:hypothetical protein